MRFSVVSFIIEFLCFSRQYIIQFRDDCEDFHFEKYCVAPTAFELYVKMSVFILIYPYPFAVIPKSFEIAAKPSGDIAAFFLQKRNFLFGDYHVFKHLYLTKELIGKAIRINGIVPVIKFVTYLCAWEVFNYRATHCELIQVVISKMSYYLAHIIYFWRLAYLYAIVYCKYNNPEQKNATLRG